ncbi:hypothetical protein ABE493_09725, partial [Stenotrophomonas terrae]|uniref:hypothetical protein n=1 Tax=Stenotrophomonas terrae TaxID=405446 RepID=UPI00320B63E6
CNRDVRQPDVLSASRVPPRPQTKAAADVLGTPQPSMARLYLRSAIHTGCVLLYPQVVDKPLQPLRCMALRALVIF